MKRVLHYMHSSLRSFATISIMMLIATLSIWAQSKQPNSGGGSSDSNKQALPTKAGVLSTLRSTTNGSFTLNGTSYDSWSTAMQNLQDGNNEIVITSDLYLLDEAWPDKPCTISSDPTDKKELKNAYTGDGGEYYANISMQAPLTFKDIKLGAWNILANGHKLVIDEGVECISGYDDKQNAIHGIYGGANDNDVEGTDITIKSGTFGWVYGGSGNTSSVNGTAKVTVSGGTVNEFIAGGGWGENATCDNTEVTMTGGTTGYMYGGGYKGSVTKTAKLSISGTASITYTLFGGSDSGTCGNTEIELAGGTSNDINGGGGFKTGSVTGTAKITMNGGTVNGLISGGSLSGTCGNTEVTVSGGTVNNSIYGGGQSGTCANTKVTVSGGVISNSIYGGGLSEKASCDNTEVNISSGTIDYVYGGGVQGNVNNTAKLNISGTAAITHMTYGGGSSGTCGNTEVNIAGGTFTGEVFGGGVSGPVTGTAKINVTGGTFNKDVYGSGFNTNASCGNTEIHISGGNMQKLFGSGLYGPVTGNVQMTIDGGNIANAVNISGALEEAGIGGDATIFIKGGTIAGVGARNAYPNNNISGNVYVTVEGTEASIGSIGLDTRKETGIEQLLTFKNCGTADTPYEAPTSLWGFSKIILENSCLTNSKKSQGTIFNSMNTNRLIIEGSGLKGTFGVALTSGDPLILNDILLRAADIPKDVKFKYSSTDFPLYKAGDTYRVGKTHAETADLKTVHITHPTEGTLSVKWEETELEDGDQVPAGTTLTVSATAATNYELKEITATPEGGDAVSISNNGNYVMTAFATTFAAAFTYTPPYIPPTPTYYTVTLPSIEGATTDPAAGDHRVEEGHSFTFTLTLADGYSQSIPVVTADGATVKSLGNGKYEIGPVSANLAISITGIEKDIPTGLGYVDEAGTGIWATNGTLFIRTTSPGHVQVISLAGSTVLYREIPAGDTRLEGLRSGAYIIRLSDKTVRKVVIR